MAADDDDHEPALGFDLTNTPKPEIHKGWLRVFVVLIALIGLVIFVTLMG